MKKRGELSNSLPPDNVSGGQDYRPRPNSLDRAKELELIDAALPDNIDAFSELFEHYRPALYGLCCRRLNDPSLAEDVVQEVFIKAFKNLSSFDRSKTVLPWLATIANRMCVDLQRHRALTQYFADPRVAVDEDADTNGHTESALDEVIASEDRAELWESLKVLPKRQRRALLLYVQDGMSYADIAAAEGISIGAVELLIVRARRKMRKQAGRPLPAIVFPFTWLRWKLQRMEERIRPLLGVYAEGFSSVCAQAVCLGALTMMLTQAPATPAVAGKSVQIPPNEQTFTEVQTKNEIAVQIATARSPSTQPEQELEHPTFVDKLLDPGAGETPESITFWSTTAVSPDYENDHTIFTAGFGGSCVYGSCHVIFVSSDGGATWKRLSAKALMSPSILLSPAYPADPRIYGFGGWSAGLQESTDGGQSFQTVSPFGMAASISPAFGKGDSRIMMDTGTEAGTIWEYWADQKLTQSSQLNRSRPLNTRFFDSSFSPGYPTHPVVFFIGYRNRATPNIGSSNPNEYWTSKRETILYRCEELWCKEYEIPIFGDPKMILSPNFVEDGIAYLFTVQDIVAYDDHSRTFRSLQRPGGGFLQNLAISPRSPGPVHPMFAATSNGWSLASGGLYRSLDGGALWTKLPLELPGFEDFKDNVLEVIVTPTGRLLATRYSAGGSGGGIACSEDGGQTWAPRCTPEQ